VFRRIVGVRVSMMLVAVIDVEVNMLGINRWVMTKVNMISYEIVCSLLIVDIQLMSTLCLIIILSEIIMRIVLGIIMICRE